MRDPLDYTEEELNSLSLEELNLLSSKSESLSTLWHTNQLAQKVLINSLYGSLANRHFPLFNEHMAAAITGNGRYFIQKLANYIEETLQKMHKSDKPYIVYGDTDSVYYQIEPFVDMFIANNPDKDIDFYVDWVDSFEKKVIQPVIERTIDDFATELNAYSKKSIGAEREIISDCVAPNTTIKIKKNGKTQKLSISQLANMFGADCRKKENVTFDISDENIEILSVNVKTGKKELKRILNIQKKTTTKRMLDLVAPNGQKITVTEDHRIAVNLNNCIIFKEAKDITEEDDVVVFDSTFYTRENQELYGLEYINHGSERCNLEERGKNISKTKQKNHVLSLEKKLVDFNCRVDALLKKHNGNYLKLFFRFCDIKKQSNLTKKSIINFCKSKNIKLPYSLISTLIISRTNRKEKLRVINIKNKYGKNYFNKIANRLNNPKNGFIIMLRRCDVINRKKDRSEKKSPLHTAKHLYRNAVKRATIQSIKNNNVENIELCDKYTWNLDHIVPVMYGFYNGIPPILIGHVNNIRVISKMENIKKRCKIDYELVDKELFKEYL